ncbi:hypothetical protein [Actinocrispum wychmicini]|uniref:Novel STAND NTPase 1 domain-containing protein n=1 Tax=Actinocrispum wychmicini TaxID=1213861 RepID=A0A4R2IQB6_9PSEU|nr:hypothetical protein [Actinocrispum wychmicini]TCO47384.1 hypothetical protein EV192_117124 [Actinocrispum wychmicini]
MTNPWVGLRPFRTTEADLFFGRSREVQIISNLVATLPTLIVYAPSGTGKSSLINAGLLPMLLDDDTHVPVTIAGPHDDILARTRTTLAEAGWPPPDELELLELLEQHWLETDRRTVVIVDQFEERINAGAPTEALFAAMAKLVHSGTDAACVLISVREDYLASLEPLMRRVPGLLNGSYRIPPLSREALEEAVYGPLRAVDASIEVDRRLVTRTIDDLEERSAGSQEPGEQRFEPGFFQIIWSTMWRTGDESKPPRLDMRTYEKLGGAGQILRNFTSEILNNLEPAQTAIFYAVSRYLVLPTGAKTALTVHDLTELLQWSDFLNSYDEDGGTWVARLPHEELTRLIRGVMGRLTASGTPILQRVIRLDREEFELLHDLLGHIILAWREEYRTSQLQTAEKFKNSIKDSVRELTRQPRPLTASRPPKSDLVPHLADEILHEADTLIWLLDKNLTEDTADQALAAVRRLLVLRSAFRELLGQAVYSSGSKADQRIEHRLTVVGGEVIHAALNHESELVRSRLQTATTYFSSAIRVVLPNQHPTSWLTVLGTLVGMGLPAVGSLVAAELVFRSAIDSLGISYHLLTMAHVAILAVAFYFALWDEASRLSAAGKLLATAIPFADDWDPRKLVLTFPLPTLVLEGVAVGTAWIFQLLGWAPTAGFNEGVLLGLVAVGGLVFFALE